MKSEDYELIPLQETQSIPVNWQFTLEEYDSMVKGHRSNWCVFLRDSIVHICRIGGEEFYRFKLIRSNADNYIARSLEVYISENFYDATSELHWRKTITQNQEEFEKFVIDETAGLLLSYFKICVKS